MSGSLYFNGSSYLTFPSSSDWAPGGEKFTVEWFQYISDFNLAPSNFPRVFSVGAYNSSTISIAATIEGASSAPTLYFWLDNSPFAFAAGPIVNQWVHFAITREGTTLHAFKNGGEMANSPYTGISVSASNSTTVLTIGQEYPLDVANSYFTGSITNLRWVSGSALYTASFTVPSFPLETMPGCVLLLSVSGSGSFLEDSSGIGKVATNYGVEFTSDDPFPFFPFPTPTPTVTITPTVTETPTTTPTPTITPTPTPSPIPYSVTTYITTDVVYGGLFSEIGGHVVVPKSDTFWFGDVIEFTCNRGWTTSVKGWYVFHIDNARFHRIGQLPLYIRSGHQCGEKIELIMHYDHDVIVVCEMT